MKKTGKELIFISCISRDGSGTVKVSEKLPAYENTQFEMNCLSVSLGTWIASEFNSYVVKIKK